MKATHRDIGLRLAQGRLPETVQQSRQELLARRGDRLGAAVTAGTDLLDRAEGVLILRAGWAAPWLRDDERSALRHHLIRMVDGTQSAGWSAGCDGPCPLCNEINDYSGYDTMARCLAAVNALGAGLIVHMVSSRADAGYSPRALTLASPGQAVESSVRLSQALDLLSAHVPWWTDLRDSTAGGLVLFESPNLLGFTSALVPRTLFVNVSCGVLQFAERLVHEATHGQVYDAQDVLRFTDAASTHLISSPLRADRRPVLGVPHATVVSARVMLAMRAVAAGAGGSTATEASAVADRVASAALAGTAELLANGQLTGAGEALVRSVYDVVAT